MFIVPALILVDVHFMGEGNISLLSELTFSFWLITSINISPLRGSDGLTVSDETWSEL